MGGATKRSAQGMNQVMTVCFWICVTCIIAGAVLGLLLVWKAIEGERLYQVWMSIVIVFLAAALTLAVGRTYLGKDPGDFPRSRGRSGGDTDSFGE
jgi:hypothetical protein